MAQVSQKELKNALLIGLVISLRGSKWLGFTATLNLKVDKLCAFILFPAVLLLRAVQSILQQEQLNTPGGRHRAKRTADEWAKSTAEHRAYSASREHLSFAHLREWQRKQKPSELKDGSSEHSVGEGNTNPRKVIDSARSYHKSERR